MPLFQNSKGSKPSILTKDGTRILAYSLSPAGLRQLRDTGVRHGGEVQPRVLAALIRSGLAHSPSVAESVGQERFNFEGDSTSQLLPRCELTGSSADIHLVVYDEGVNRVAQLLSFEPRFVLRKATSLSIPATAVTSDLLAQLENAGQLPPKSVAAEILREWLRLDLARTWEQLSINRRTAELQLGTDSELPLVE